MHSYIGNISILKRIMVLLAVFFLYSCVNDDSENNLLRNINDNKAKWATSNIQTYRYQYSIILSDCPTVDTLPPMMISVEAGSVVSVFNSSSGVFDSNLENWPTIDQIFDKMIVLANQEFKHFSKSTVEPDRSPAFNTDYGYPISFYVDKSDAECDAQYFTISEFQ